MQIGEGSRKQRVIYVGVMDKQANQWAGEFVAWRLIFKNGSDSKSSNQGIQIISVLGQRHLNYMKGARKQ